MNGHDRIEELLAARALDGLDPADEDALERELGTHGPACADCHRLRLEFDEVAGRMAFALPPSPVRAGVEDEILARARIDGRPDPDEGTARVRALERPRAAREEDRPGTWLRTAVALAAAFALFAGGWIAGSALREDSPIDLRSARVVDFDAQAGTLSMAYEPGKPGVLILGSDLPSPGVDKVYGLWMIEDDTPTSGGCLVPGPDGSIAELVDAEMASTEVMAVTVEPSSCPAAPTTDPIATASLL
ncbi:MAG: anti-sigma factor [Actinomycetota bacterium]